jgi:hypothetical protein
MVAANAKAPDEITERLSKEPERWVPDDGRPVREQAAETIAHGCSGVF